MARWMPLQLSQTLVQRLLNPESATLHNLIFNPLEVGKKYLHIYVEFESKHSANFRLIFHSIFFF